MTTTTLTTLPTNIHDDPCKFLATMICLISYLASLQPDKNLEDSEWSQVVLSCTMVHLKINAQRTKMEYTRRL